MREFSVRDALWLGSAYRSDWVKSKRFLRQVTPHHAQRGLCDRLIAGQQQLLNLVAASRTGVVGNAANQAVVNTTSTATNDPPAPQLLAELTHQRVRELSAADLTALRHFAQQGIHRAELGLRPGALQRLEAEDLVQEVVCEILTGAESPNAGYHPELREVGTLSQFLGWIRTLIQRRIARSGLFAAATPELPEPKQFAPATVPPAP